MSKPSDRFVLFFAGGSRWAIPAQRVAEVLPTTELERPPGSPGVLAGFMNLGGRAMAVISVARLFDAEPAGTDDLYHHVLRLAVPDDEAPIGLLVERVTDVDAKGEGMAPLDAAQSVNGAVVGNLLVGSELAPLLDWGRLLLVEEERRIRDLAAAAQARLAELDRAAG